MGAARGIDEGLISGTFATKHFQKSLGLNKLNPVEFANVKGNVSAMVQIGSVAGAALAFVLADRIGRLWATRQLCILWILGIVIFLTNRGSLGQVYAGRFIAGLGKKRQTSRYFLEYPFASDSILTYILYRYWPNHRDSACIYQ